MRATELRATRPLSSRHMTSPFHGMERIQSEQSEGHEAATTPHVVSKLVSGRFQIHDIGAVDPFHSMLPPVSNPPTLMLPSREIEELSPTKSTSDANRPPSFPQLIDAIIDTKVDVPTWKLSMPQLSDRIKVHDNAIRQEAALKETEIGAPAATDSQKVLAHERNHPSSAVQSLSDGLSSRFVPLQAQWSYAQRIFGRYKKTPYFYSGNIAAYLGSGMFMVVFDDGTLDYHIRSEDMMLREYPVSSPVTKKTALTRLQQIESQQLSFRSDGEFKSIDTNNAAKVSADATSRLSSTQKHLVESKECPPDTSLVPEMHLLPSQHVMVDFSISPPRELILSFDDNETSCERGDSRHDIPHTCNEARSLLSTYESLTMKRLECGVGYEDDSTQPSDSDDLSEEDLSMTPWQQMTQTFGMGKGPRTRRRSSISSIDRLSITQKSTSQIVSTPKSLKQIIAVYFLRGTKKVQPSTLKDETALAEHIRLMEAKLNCLRSSQSNSGSPTAANIRQGDPKSLRVVYKRDPDGVRTYGTVMEEAEDGNYAVVTEIDDLISVQLVPKTKVDVLPFVCELEQQLHDLERLQHVLYAGQKVHVSLYPGSRFSGRGVITMEQEYQSRFHVLLANRIRLLNVPADKIIPLQEKKKTVATISDDQFLVCSNKVNVYIGDQIYVKCLPEYGNLTTATQEEKIGLLNGVYSNQTAAVDFADGSTGYEVPPHLIFKRKKRSITSEDQDLRSLKNAVLMQASGGANSGAKDNLLVLEEGYQVKADHPRKAAVESCIIIKVHPSSACDLCFSDNTIAFEVFSSQMVFDNVDSPTNVTVLKNESVKAPVFDVGDYVLAWSSRFQRYCSAKITAKVFQSLCNGSGPLSSPSEELVSTFEPPVDPTDTISDDAAGSKLIYTLVFDYGEQKTQMPAEKITRLDNVSALSHSQRLTNLRTDAMGFELSAVSYVVGEAVMARVHGSARYFNGVVEKVEEKERVCTVYFDSSERDLAVPFSSMFSVDLRARSLAQSSSTKKQARSLASSSSGAASLARFLARKRETTSASGAMRAMSRPSNSSVGSMLKSMDEFFRRKAVLDLRRHSCIVTEIGARIRRKVMRK